MHAPAERPEPCTVPGCPGTLRRLRPWPEEGFTIGDCDTCGSTRTVEEPLPQHDHEAAFQGDNS